IHQIEPGHESGSMAADNTINNSVAVMPFTILNPASENTLFALGLHDEVTSQLTKIRNLNVISRSSVLALADKQLPEADMARLLGVESVMGGTILFARDRARITLQLTNPRTGVSLWSG